MNNKWFTYIDREFMPDSHETGSMKAWWLTHRSLAKTGESRRGGKNEFLIINEWIAANIGWYLRLPVPPFSIMRKSKSSPRYFASVDFGGKSRKPTDMRAQAFCKYLRKEASEVLVFDILIGNPDRHEGNLKVDSPARPTSFEVFDHDQALLGDRGIKRLDVIKDRLGLTLKLRTSGDFHKFAEHIPSVIELKLALQKIESIPPEFIQAVCNEAVSFGLTKTEAKAVTNFLVERKTNIGKMIHLNRSFFSAISDWELFL